MGADRPEHRAPTRAKKGASLVGPPWSLGAEIAGDWAADRYVARL
jgi:hypothetical protein